MEAKFSHSNKSIKDLFSLAFYCPSKPLQSAIHCPTPLHAFMSYPVANSAYLQAMSMQVNSITLRKCLRHWKQFSVPANCLWVGFRDIPASTSPWQFLITVWEL